MSAQVEAHVNMKNTATGEQTMDQLRSENEYLRAQLAAVLDTVRATRTPSLSPEARSEYEVVPPTP